MTAPQDPLTVIITMREIYDVVVRLTGKMDVFIAQHEETKTKIADHESRIRNLEKRQWPLPVLSIVIALAGLVLTLARYIVIK